METRMSWLKRDTGGPWIDPERTKGWIRRDDGSSRSIRQGDTTVVTTRDYPGKVTSRTIRNDVYQDALRAAESSLRNSARKK
jgi:hypothetical protein